MSSGTSTDRAGALTRPIADAGPSSTASDTDGRPTPGRTREAAGLRPWQFFVLAGMLGATAAVVVSTGQPIASVVVLSLTVVAASLVGLAAYRTCLPFVSPAAVRPPEMVDGRARAAIDREKTLVLRAIKDLEFDKAMGKVSPADFDEMSSRLRARALGLLQQLEGHGAYRARIERELAERLARMPAATPAPGTCAACGTSNDTDARFCKQCGAALGDGR